MKETVLSGHGPSIVMVPETMQTVAGVVVGRAVVLGWVVTVVVGQGPSND